eukprot:5282514-Prymnesium_polylepis.1
MNSSDLRKDGDADVMQLQQRSRSLMSKNNYRRSIVVKKRKGPQHPTAGETPFCRYGMFSATDGADRHHTPENKRMHTQAATRRPPPSGLCACA